MKTDYRDDPDIQKSEENYKRMVADQVADDAAAADRAAQRAADMSAQTTPIQEGGTGAISFENIDGAAGVPADTAEAARERQQGMRSYMLSLAISSFGTGGASAEDAIARAQVFEQYIYADVSQGI